MKKQGIIALVLVFTIVFSAAPAPVAAQSTTYQPRTTQEMIAYLYGIIAQLEAQLQAQRAGTGQVLGVSNSYQTSTRYRSNYDIDVVTLSANNIEENEAQLRANIDLDGASYAIGWFEYGEDSDLDEKTSTVRITNRGDDTRSFVRTIDDLDEDEVYFYRAVAQGPDGRKDYGSIRSFRTDDDGRRSSSRNNDEPDVETGRATDIEETRALIEGEFDLNNVDEPRVAFVVGEDRDEVEDADRENSLSDIRRIGDDVFVTRIHNLDDDDDEHESQLYSLTEDTRYYYRLCVDFEDDDNDEQMECGDVEDFRTDD